MPQKASNNPGCEGDARIPKLAGSRWVDRAKTLGGLICPPPSDGLSYSRVLGWKYHSFWPMGGREYGKTVRLYELI